MSNNNVISLATKITILRILLVPFFIAFILYSKWEIALIIFIVASLSDSLDGYVARITKHKTELGKMLDPLADKLLILSAFICLSVIGGSFKLPFYVPIAVISRDAIILLGSFIIYVTKGKLEVKPTILGKLTTFFQMVTIVSVLARFDFSYILWNITVLFTILSGINYVLIGMKTLNEK